MLKSIASIYDSVGFIQPLTVRLKAVFQEICTLKFEWDTELNDEMKRKWNEIISDIQQMPELIIPRAYCINTVSDPIQFIEMHGFSDASELAFGACIYLKFVKKVVIYQCHSSPQNRS